MDPGGDTRLFIAEEPAGPGQVRLAGRLRHRGRVAPPGSASAARRTVSSRLRNPACANEPARAAYRRAGFTQTGQLMSVLFWAVPASGDDPLDPCCR